MTRVHGALRLVWLVEKRGRVLARLDDARFAEMFWVSYRVTDVTTTDADRAELFSSSFWTNEPMPTFVHEATGIRREHAFAGGTTPTIEAPWVWMRALYPPSFLERLAECVKRSLSRGLQQHHSE